MIAQIQGTVIDVFDKGVVIDTGSIGYAVFTPATIELGKFVIFYTHLVIKEDAQELYGFQNKEERMLFNSLISVSGVGPKTALQMLIMYPLNEIIRAIHSGDSKAISLVPGIGKKTAEKVIIDLHDKLKNLQTEEQKSSTDLVEALLSLGFKDYDIRLALPTVDSGLPLEKQITIALQILRK